MTSLPLKNQQEFENPEPRKKFSLDRDTKIGLGIMGAILLAVFFLTSRSNDKIVQDNDAMTDISRIRKQIEDTRKKAEAAVAGGPVIQTDAGTDAGDHASDAQIRTDLTAPDIGPVPVQQDSVAHANTTAYKEHKLQANENPSTLSRLYYNTTGKAQLIMDFNGLKKGDEKKLQIGKVLKIPTLSPALDRTSNPVQAPQAPKTSGGVLVNAPKTSGPTLNLGAGMKTYTINAYDSSPSSLCKKLLGDAKKLEELKALNPDVNWKSFPVGTTIRYKK